MSTPSGNRKTCRTRVTKLCTEVDRHFAETIVENAAEERLMAMLAVLNLANDQLRQSNNEIEVDDETAEAEDDAVYEYETKVAFARAKLECGLARMRESATATRSQPATGASASAASSSTTALTTNSAATSTCTKLPRVEIPRFSGDPKEWIAFWDQFRIQIHDNQRVDIPTKFALLQQHLLGRAAESIKGFTPTETSYKDAVKVLRDEFASNEKITEAYLRSLTSLPRVSSASDAKSLRRLYTTVVTTMRSLKSLGVNSGQYCVILKSHLLSALPGSMQLQYHRTTRCANEASAADDASSATTETEETLLDRLIKFLKAEVESLELCSDLQPSYKNSHSQNRGGNDRNDHQKKRYRNQGESSRFSAASLVTANNGTANNARRTNNDVCAFCNATGHKTEVCKVSMSLQDKKERLKNGYRCFRCTRKDHSSRGCRSSIVCITCRGRHATTMCDPEYRRTAGSNSAGIALRASDERQPAVANEVSRQDGGQPARSAGQMAAFTLDHRHSHVFLQTASVYASKPAQAGDQTSAELPLRLVIDGGSQITSIKESVSRRLQLPILYQTTTSVLPFGSKERGASRVSNVVSLALRSQHGDSVVTIQAVETPNICVDVLAVPDAGHPKLAGLQLADARTGAITPIEGLSLLIGADQIFKITDGESQKITQRLIAVNTAFGWTLHGPYGDTSTREAYSGLVAVLQTCAEQEIDLTPMWSLELMGIQPNDPPRNDAFVGRYLCESISRNEDGRYVARLPFNEDKHVILNDHYFGARAQLQRLTASLSRVPGRLEQYDAAIRELIANDYAEAVPNPNDDVVKFYIPHRPVFRHDKSTTQLRVVYNASAHRGGYPSLNGTLYAGPNLNPDIMSVLLNFRTGRIGLCADIRQAFLQIALHPDERDLHRFLWYNAPLTTSSALPDVREHRMNRVTFGVRSSPFMLSAVLQKHLQSFTETDTEIIKFLQAGFYVDDLVLSLDDWSTAEAVFKRASEILADAKMLLRKWTTNDPQLRERFEPFEEVQKVLGVTWNTSSDLLSINTDCSEASQVWTKRTSLKCFAQIFDPLGLIAPILVKPKLLIQSMWRDRIGWDVPLPLAILAPWSEWYQGLEALKDYAVPRHAIGGIDGHNRNVELHVFADASPAAYGAVAYLRTTSDADEPSVTLLCSKSRITPVKTNTALDITLPKLELTAALVAARMADYLQKNVRITVADLYLWTDSLITLYWIRGDPNRWKPYVASRTREIQALVGTDQWRHLPGSENPADLLTRGIQAHQIIRDKRWLNGPHWLSQTSDQWPGPVSCDSVDPPLSLSLIAPTAEHIEIIVPDFKRFSKLNRLLRSTAYLRRAVANFRSLPSERPVSALSSSEVEEAESYLIRAVQRQFYTAEINELQSSRPIPKDSKILTLNPFLDQLGVLRVGGRLQELDDSEGIVHPIIMPKESRFSLLLLRQAHETLHHGGVPAIITYIRSRFWIVRARQLTKSIVSSCVTCRRLRTRAASEPPAPLPRDRITQAPPFEITGLDFAGPLHVGESGEKAYVLLLTCGVVRAVHLELVPDMTTESCLNALRRFIARRGVPRVIYSDNARSFHRASLELSVVCTFVESEALRDFIQERRIEWRFIVERAAWWGGWWERLVRSVKTALKSTLRRRLLNFHQMSTILTEVEATINSRPLTFASDCPTDPQPLTPAHFFAGAPLVMYPRSGPLPETPVSIDLRKEWRKRQSVLNVFWSRWTAEYLCQLRSAHHSRPAPSSALKVGDVVIVREPSTPRLRWRMGVIINCFPGRDGRVRACELRVSGSKAPTVIRRPVQCLYPLELNA